MLDNNPHNINCGDDFIIFFEVLVDYLKSNTGLSLLNLKVLIAVVPTLIRLKIFLVFSNWTIATFSGGCKIDTPGKINSHPGKSGRINPNKPMINKMVPIAF